MKRIPKALAALWRAEPVLLGALGPVLTMAGFTADQAHSVNAAVAGGVVIAAQLVAAFGVRAKVKPNVKPNDVSAQIVKVVQAANDTGRPIRLTGK